MNRVNALRDRHGLLIIEDAAHALGAEWDGRQIGTHGNLTCFSFYATKNVTTAEGGAVATDDSDVAAELERLALHGLSHGAWERFSDARFRHYLVEEPGFKFNLTDLHAAIGLHQLPRLDAWIQRRAELWARYDELLADLPLIRPAPAPDGMRHARHLYSVLVRDEAPVSRDELLDRLIEAQIGSGVHYIAVHRQPYYRDRYAIKGHHLPVADDISRRTVSLPLSPKVTDTDQDDVVAALHDVLGA
jgi:dTDP-4-amino-4,6-dideoxygalactose transaminase